MSNFNIIAMEHTPLSIEQKLERLEKLAAAQQKEIDQLKKSSLAGKDVLTFGEASTYTGISKSTLYKLTSAGAVPHYKPTGKPIFFDRKEMEQWLLSNKVKTHDEIQSEAMNYIMKKNLKP